MKNNKIKIQQYKIAKQIMSMYFNHYSQNNITILSNNQNGYIEYFIQKTNGKYNVLKIKKLDRIQKEFNQYTIDQINEFLFGCEYDDLINYKQQFVYEIYTFDQKQLQEYFIKSDKIKMNPLQFYSIFKIKSNSFQFVENNGIDVYIENGYNKNIVDQCLKQFMSFHFFKKLKNICFIFVNKIVERDGHNIGGNYLKDAHQYNAQFVVGNINPKFDLFHQIGHYISQIKFNDKKLKQIYNVVVNDCNFNFKDYYYKTNFNQCFAQLIAHYFCKMFNNYGIQFVQNYILTNI